MANDITNVNTDMYGEWIHIQTKQLCQSFFAFLPNGVLLLERISSSKTRKSKFFSLRVDPFFGVDLSSMEVIRKANKFFPFVTGG